MLPTTRADHGTQDGDKVGNALVVVEAGVDTSCRAKARYPVAFTDSRTQAGNLMVRQAPGRIQAGPQLSRVAFTVVPVYTYAACHPNRTHCVII